MTRRPRDRHIPAFPAAAFPAAVFLVAAILVAAILAGLGGCGPGLAPGGSTALTPATASPPSPSDLLVYFLDEGRYAAAIPPYEVIVRRPATGVTDVESRALATVRALFAGPTPDERAAGLTVVTSGFSGVRTLRLIDGVAHVYLDGTCQGGGATYTIANLIRANLLPFPEIVAVKVYDEHGDTEQPTGPGDSIPLCLEP